MHIHITHSIDSENIAYALGGFSQDEVRKFARTLLMDLADVDDDLTDAFAEGIAEAQQQLAAEP